MDSEGLSADSAGLPSAALVNGQKTARTTPYSEVREILELDNLSPIEVSGG